MDEIKCSIVEGSKAIVVKSVCNNFTALPVVYRPGGNTWGPPYTPESSLGPLFLANESCGGKGFEEPTLYEGPDGYLHFQGSLK